MGLRRRMACLGAVLALLVGCDAAPSEEKVLMIEGRNQTIPALSEDLVGVHLRDVGMMTVTNLSYPAGLRDLNLSANGINFLPSGLVPSGIQRLWLADNALMLLPEEATSWTQLTYLNLDRNLLSELPDLSRTKLRWVRLNKNRLSLLPPLPETVETLTVADNNLQAFYSKPRALRSLTLAGNPLTQVAETLGVGLEWLDLSRTHLTKLPHNLEGWQSLKVLNLAQCPLSEAEKTRIEAAFATSDTTLIF